VRTSIRLHLGRLRYILFKISQPRL
jgi:hypothetical protein